MASRSTWTSPQYHGCWLEEGRAAIRIDDLDATVIPKKSFLGRRSPCPDIIYSPESTVDLEFSRAGLGAITVVGLSAVGFPGEPAGAIRLMRHVVVTETNRR